MCDCESEVRFSLGVNVCLWCVVFDSSYLSDWTSRILCFRVIYCINRIRK